MVPDNVNGAPTTGNISYTLRYKLKVVKTYVPTKTSQTLLIETKKWKQLKCLSTDT